MTKIVTIDGINYARICCYKCAVLFLLPEKLNRTALQKGPDHTFWCPNGHAQAYTESATDKLRLERDRAVQEQARLELEKREAEAKAAKAERALQRHKKRSAAGTCPCCSRTFSQLARHMKTRHPDFVAEAAHG